MKSKKLLTAFALVFAIIAAIFTFVMSVTLFLDGESYIYTAIFNLFATVSLDVMIILFIILLISKKDKMGVVAICGFALSLTLFFFLIANFGSLFMNNYGYYRYYFSIYSIFTIISMFNITLLIPSYIALLIVSLKNNNIPQEVKNNQNNSSINNGINKNSSVDQLKNLQQLYECGAINKEEYSKMLNDILGE